MNDRLRLALCLAFAIASLGCGAVDRNSLRASLDRRDLDGARQTLESALDTRAGEAPKQIGGQYGRTLLERAIVRAAQEDFRGAAGDLALADRGLGLDDLIRNGRTRGLATPEAFRYAYLRGWAQALNIPPGMKFYEWLLLNPLGALFRLEDGDAAGACVEARRFGAVADWTESIAPSRAGTVRAFGEVTTAIACDAAGDEGLACSALAKSGSAASAVASSRVAERCRTGERRTESELVVVIAYGRVSHPLIAGPGKPIEIEGGAETSVASDLVLRIDGHEAEPAKILDVEGAVRDDFTEAKRAIEITILGVKGRTGDWSPWAWELLPAQIALAHVALAPGPHEIAIEVRETKILRKVDVAAGTRVVTAIVPW